MHFTDDDIKHIKDASEKHLIDVVQDFRNLRKSGTSYVCDCPMCKASKKFSINPAKDIYSCFSCHQISGSGALDYLMRVEKKEFPEALEHLAHKFNVILDQRPEQKKKPVTKMKQGSKKAKGNDTNSFCAKMLSASGLTFEDVTARIYKTDDTKSIFETRTFRPGTINDSGVIDPKGDDVIIEYYDLEGMPVTYARKDHRKRETGERKEYFRVRWQFPDAHLDKEGKPFKYKSPAGSGTPIYIPEKLRRMYKEKKEIPRLFIQEGEKKAEKACKHGIPSIAVSGIQNLGSKENNTLPEDVVKIITACNVKEVAFIFDSDWDDISTNIKLNDRVEKRPYCFFYAARNFKEYMRTLKNRNIYVEIYVGHIQKNDAGDKGIDDLLANSLKDHENELAEDIEFACNAKKGLGKYVEMFKVTTLTDHKMLELWCLHSNEAFSERHKDVLKNLPEFVFGRYRWKFDDTGKLVLAQPFDDDEKFWEEVDKETRSGIKTEYQFCYVNSHNFLQNRGFGRLRRLDKTYQFVHLDPPVVRSIDASDARDYLFQFAKHYCKKEVNEMLIKGVSQSVGPDKLSLLNFIEPNFIKPNRESQYFYFNTKCWYVTKDNVQEIGYEVIDHHIWEEQQKIIPAKYLGSPLIRFKVDQDNQYSYTLSEEGKKSHYLQFLINTSNFTWRKSKDDFSPEEENENHIHLLSKLCAIGYMAMEAKDSNVAKAVIGMDGKQSEVGDSNGRSGKSLIGELLRCVVPTAYIPGKRSDIFNDQFIWNDVLENTKFVFIDDVLQNFNFEFLFPNITGDWSVNYKGGRRITLPFERSPKIYIATNHAIRGRGSSFTDRQWLLAFSDYYNDSHKPVDDFGIRFFSEWDFDQWNLTWNLLANCIQLYLQYGVIQAPGERLEQRILRQEIGETLISWADEYFSSEEHLNHRLVKKDLYDAFCIYDPMQRKYISPTAFKKKFIMYCDWKGYLFNPHKYDSKTGKPFKTDKDGCPVLDDKAGGVEYFTVGTGTCTGDSYSADTNFEDEQKLIDF